MCGVTTPQTLTQWLAGITGNNLVDAELARAFEVRLPRLPIRFPIPFADLFRLQAEFGNAGTNFVTDIQSVGQLSAEKTYMDWPGRHADDVFAR